MAEEQYDKALSALDDAEKYAVKSPEEQYAVDVSRANFYAAAAGTEIDKDSNFNDKAYELMNQLVVSEYGSPEEKNELVLALGELCISMQKVDEAIQLMQMLTEESETAEEDAAPAGELSFEADPAEVDAEQDVTPDDAISEETLVAETRSPAGRPLMVSVLF